jgi:hypothetical protein
MLNVALSITPHIFALLVARRSTIGEAMQFMFQYASPPDDIPGMAKQVGTGPGNSCAISC